jgi:type VI protein secretion system component VasK
VTEKKRETPWFWYLLAIGLLYLLASRFGPLKTVNEMYPFPNTFSAHVLAVFIFIIAATAWFTLAFRKGRTIRKDVIAKRKVMREQDGQVSR